MNRPCVGAAVQRLVFFACLLAACVAMPARAQQPDPGTPPPEIEAVLAHPIFARFYSCTEHWAGQFQSMGDALGTDCVIQRFVTVNGRMWMRTHAGDGRRNEQWYGWGEDVLSPCDCTVVKATDNPVVNKPGVLGPPPAAILVLKREDGVFFMLGHVTRPRVKEGDILKRGQVMAQVGNNGMSRHPHIHMGAWKGRQPLQIRFDQVAMAELARVEMEKMQ